MEWLLQRCSIAIVRGNAASVLLGAATCRDETLMLDKTDGLPKDYCEQATLSESGCGRKCRRQTDDVWESGGPHPRIPSQRHQHFASTGPAVSLPVGATGIENLGNTCYMNAVLQILAHTRSFVSHLSARFFHNDNNQTTDHSKLVTEVAQLLDAISSGKHRTVSPRRLRAELSARSTEFCDSRMHDAHEFLIRLLEWLHDDLKVATIVAISPSASYPGSSTSSESADIAWRQFQCSNSSIISRIFHGLQMSTLHCIACGYESSKSEIFSVLSLPLVEEEGQVRLHHCLYRYTRGNFVKDWTCPSCCKTNDVYMRLDYWRLPPVIIFHLKRFSFSGTTSQKIDTRVSFTLHDLDLSQLATGPYSDSHSMVYDLIGVVEHHGGQNSGHYTAYCFNQPAGRWFFTSDFEVRECSPAEVKDASAYILVYATKASDEARGTCLMAGTRQLAKGWCDATCSDDRIEPPAGGITPERIEYRLNRITPIQAAPW